MVESLTWFVALIDPVLIAPYRWPSDPILGWWVGTTLVCLWCTLLGELTMALAFRANRSHIKAVVREMGQRHDQSMNALKAGDRGAYKSINKLANEAFGKTFFLQVSMAAASLWPVPFALGWMQSRFAGIDFPLPAEIPGLGEGVGYPFIFIPLYVLTRIAFGKVKKYLVLPLILPGQKPP